MLIEKQRKVLEMKFEWLNQVNGCSVLMHGRSR